MSVTPETPEGGLGTKVDPIVFTSDVPIVSISAEYNPETGTGPRETVYDGTDVTNENGSFSYLYRNSIRDGNEWTIVRENGWPAPFKLAIKDVIGGAVPGLPSRAALTPTLYNPIGQWALQGFPDTARGYLDRSGNGYHLTHGTPLPGTDLIPGQKAARPVVGQKLQRRTITPAMQVTGAFTYSIRFKLDAIGTTQQLGSFSSVYGPTVAQGTNWELGISASGRLWYARSPANPFASLDYRDSSAGFVVTPNVWTYATLRRAASGNVTWGLNFGFEDAAPISLPPAGISAAYLTIGSDGDTNNEVNGLIVDANYWGTFLTDEELLPLIVVALGV